MNFTERLDQAWRRNDSLLCVGLDPDPERLPEAVRGADDPVFERTLAKYFGGERDAATLEILAKLDQRP